MKPVRTYEIMVASFPPALYCARSPAKARARCFRDFTSAFEVTFRQFLKDCRLRVVPNPPGVGDQILVNGKPATRIHHPCAGHYVWFIFDNSDDVLCSHPLDVQPIDIAWSSKAAFLRLMRDSLLCPNIGSTAEEYGEAEIVLDLSEDGWPDYEKWSAIYGRLLNGGELTPAERASAWAYYRTDDGAEVPKAHRLPEIAA